MIVLIYSSNISTDNLNNLRCLQLLPINVVVYYGSFVSCETWISHLGNGFSLRCIQRLSNTIVATQQCVWRQQLAHQGMAHLGPLVLKANSLKNPTLTADRDQPVLRRFEPSSRSALMGEQTNPWNLLQLQDALSRPKIIHINMFICALQLLLVVWTISFVKYAFYFHSRFYLLAFDKQLQKVVYLI